MIMYVYDRRWPTRTPMRPKYPEDEVESFYVEPEHTIATIAVFIKQRAKGRKITLLHLFGHGEPGILYLGKGLTKKSAHYLRPIRDLMAPDGHVELHGCNVASATPTKLIDKYTCTPGSDAPYSVGRQFLKAIAQAINKPVTAGIECQRDNVMTSFEGKKVTVKP